MIKKFWNKLKYWQKVGLIGGICYTLFAYYWGYIGLDIACNYLYPKTTAETTALSMGSLNCLGLLLPLFPAVIINNWLDDNLLRLIVTDWRTSDMYIIFGFIVGTLVYFIQGFLMGALLAVIFNKITKR